MQTTMAFAAKTAEQVRTELRGYPASTVIAALRYRETGRAEDLMAMMPGIIAYHLPKGAPRPPEILPEELRLVRDLGLDSLALSEMVFMLEDLLGFSVNTDEVHNIGTVGELRRFLEQKLDAEQPLKVCALCP